MKTQPKHREPTITKQDSERIAREILDIETLEERLSDELDFPEVAVWNIEAVLKEAFKLGRQSNQKMNKAKQE
jgi:hypothetical protein